MSDMDDRDLYADEDGYDYEDDRICSYPCAECGESWDDEEDE